MNIFDPNTEDKVISLEEMFKGNTDNRKLNIAGLGLTSEIKNNVNSVTNFF